MFAIFTWTRALLAALVLTVLATAAQATSPRRTTAHTLPTGADRLQAVAEEPPPPGSPELGILLIIGVVGLLIFMAWLVSRVSDDNSPRGDGSII